MISGRPISLLRVAAGAVLALAVAPFVTSSARASVKLVETDNLSIELGLRMQPRMELDRGAAIKGGKQWNRDFLIRRTRIKLGGRMETATYNFEVKIDRTDQSNVNPTASVENAWIQYPLMKGMDLRAGLYDQPFSRDLLVSDSKTLAVDRGAVSNVPNALGLCDNAVGFDLRGKVKEGHAEYAVGLFDNRVVPGGLQRDPMVVGRMDFNFLSTKDVFKDGHFGSDSWCSLGLNGGYQGSIENEQGVDHGSNAIGGVDGMVDVPVGSLRLFTRSEANVIRIKPPGGGNAVDTRVWMAGLGLLFKQKFQPMVRFDETRVDNGGIQDVTYVGANYYRREHSLKLQSDVRFQSGTHEAVDGWRLQLQLDF